MPKDNTDLCQHYYIRDDENKPYACVAIIPLDFQEGKVCRGIAICSDKDQWNKRGARGRAVSRAIKAHADGKHSLQCRNAKRPVISDFLHNHGQEFSVPVPTHMHGPTDVMAVFKSAHNVAVTEREKRLMEYLQSKIDSEKFNV